MNNKPQQKNFSSQFVLVLMLSLSALIITEIIVKVIFGAGWQKEIIVTYFLTLAYSMFQLARGETGRKQEPYQLLLPLLLCMVATGGMVLKDNFVLAGVFFVYSMLLLGEFVFWCWQYTKHARKE